MAGRSPGGNKKYDYIYYRYHHCKIYVNENDIVNQIKKIILDLVEYDFLVSGIFAPVLINKVGNSKDNLIKEIDNLKRQKNRIKDAYKNGVVEINEFADDIKLIDERIKVIKNKMDNSTSNICLDLDDINLYKDVEKIKQIKLNKYYQDQIMLWTSWSKDRQQELFMKYIDSIELEEVEEKIEIKKVNFKKSFLDEYSNLFLESVIDLETNLVSRGQKSTINISYFKTREDIKNYINKLRKYYDIDYYETRITYDEEDNIKLEYEPNDNSEIIKLISIKEQSKFSKPLTYGVIALT